jgi:uncharacterized RDD family membrane protein YckC
MTGTQPSTWEPPERIAGPAPGVEFADFGPRLVAYLVDILIVTAVVIVGTISWAVVAAATGGITGSGMDAFAGVWLTVMVVVVSVIGLAYFPFFWARFGATPGMKMMNLRVVRDADGGPISTGQAILRLVGYWVSGLVLYLGYIWILIDKRRRGWHDLIAGTVVIKAP